MATMKTLNGYGFNATELNGKAASDYLQKTDTATNSAKLGGKAPEYYIQQRNLLDNSDFRNPVNQRGFVNGNAVELYHYFIDRWTSGELSINPSLNNNGIMSNGAFYQRLDNLSTYIGRNMTFAIGLSSGDIVIASGTLTDVTDNDITIFNTTDGQNEISVGSDGGMWYVWIDYPSSTIQWAALYEGSYTAETLPPYVPKGYAAELAECQRYFERLGSKFSEQIGNIAYVVSGAKSFVCSLQCSRKRIQHPSVSFSGVDNYRLLLKDATNAGTYSAATISSFDSITSQEPFISFRANMVDAITQNSWIQLQRSDRATAAYIDVSADL